MSEKLGGTQPGSLQGFNAFILQHVIKACFEVPLSPRFNLDDAASLTVLTEIVALQKSVQTVCGEEFSNLMLGVLLPSLKLPHETAVTYLNTLKSSAINDFRTYLRVSTAVDGTQFANRNSVGFLQAKPRIQLILVNSKIKQTCILGRRLFFIHVLLSDLAESILRGKCRSRKKGPKKIRPKTANKKLFSVCDIFVFVIRQSLRPQL